ncbi:hypothetical protein R1sor_025582 [Riccia sorocarpa]|uniref:Uncharacterized protein n=1 Tax=Riccia sorocarpa TaxID=122646 RepID=A0ABD3GEN8_9MARC
MSRQTSTGLDQAIFLRPAKDSEILARERGLAEAIERLRSHRAEFRRSISDLQSELRKLQGVRESLVKPLKTYSLVLILLATVTFITNLLPPGGYPKKSLLNTIFSVCCSMSFYLSVGGLILCLGCSMPKRDDALADAPSLDRDNAEIEWGKVARLHVDATDRAIDELLEIIIKFVGVNAVLVVSICLCVGAFAAAGVASSSPDLQGNRIMVVCTSSAGCAVVGSTVLQLVTHVYTERRVSPDPTMSHMSRIGHRIVHFFEIVAFLLSVMVVSFLPGMSLVRLFGLIQSQFSSDLRDSTLFRVLGLDKLFAVYADLERRSQRKGGKCSSPDETMDVSIVQSAQVAAAMFTASQNLLPESLEAVFRWYRSNGKVFGYLQVVYLYREAGPVWQTTLQPQS